MATAMHYPLRLPKSLSPKSRLKLKWMPKLSLGDPCRSYSREMLLQWKNSCGSELDAPLFVVRDREFHPWDQVRAMLVDMSYLQKLWAHMHAYDNVEQMGWPITSLMLSNIPVNLKPTDCVRILQEYRFGADLKFLYCARGDKEENAGTCMVNFASPDSAHMCFEIFHGRIVGENTVNILPTRTQGIEWNLEDLRRDLTLETLEADSVWRPVMIEKGQPVPFTVARTKRSSRLESLCNGASPRRDLAGPVNPQEHTTVMVRNIPNKYTRTMFYDRIRELFAPDEVDFMYMPVDFTYGTNVGYAFVNFRSSAAVQRAIDVFHCVECHKALPGFKSNKVVELTAARVQGVVDNIAHFQKSHVLGYIREGHTDWTPLLFDKTGKRIPFPIVGAKRGRKIWSGTTVTITNLPSECTRDAFVQALNDAQLRGAYDFVNVTDKTATVNFRHPQGALCCGGFFHGKKAHDVGLGTDSSILDVSTSIVQGLNKNIEKISGEPMLFPEPPFRGTILRADAAPYVQHSFTAVTKEMTEWQLKQILRHMEYYFSDENLLRDVFLRSHMDSDGFVPVNVLLRFPTLTRLSTTHALVADCVKLSTLLEGNDMDKTDVCNGKNGRVRIKDETRRAKWVYAV